MKSKEEIQLLFSDLINKFPKIIHTNAIILFGSQAKGTAHKYSDYDILVIADFSGEFEERYNIVQKFTPFVSIDLFCYTSEEFRDAFYSYNLTAIDAIGEGLVLYDNNFVEKYKLKYVEFVRRGMRKTTSVLVPPN